MITVSGAFADHWQGPDEGVFARFRLSEDDFERRDDSWIERPIFTRFELIAARHPEKIALDDGACRLTYLELRRAAQHLAHRIEKIVPIGRPVGILLPNGALFPVAALACLAVGRVYVPIDLNYPVERNDQIIREAGLAAVIIDREGGASRSGLAAIPHLGITESLGNRNDCSISIAQIGAPAVVLYTSGSTGLPKGICNDQRAISLRVAQFTNACHLHPNDRFILLSSPGTIAGIRDTFAALLTGATLYIADPHQVGMGGILRVFRDHRITICYAVPALLRELLRLPTAKQACGDVRIIRFGGDTVLASDIALCRASLPRDCRILVGYGSTEAPTIFQWFVPPDWTPDGSVVPCGYALPEISISLLTECGTPAASGEVAEVIVRSRYVAIGTWQDGRLQRQAFQVDPEDASVRIVRTGDLVRMRADGLAELVGRKDRQLKIRGLRVDPSDVESVLRGCDDVADAVVTGRSGDRGDVLVAYVVSRISNTASLREHLHDVITKRLPAHMRPARFQFVAEIPRLSSFKPDVKMLQKLDNSSATKVEVRVITAESAAIAIPPSLAREAVERAWTEVLNRPSFAADLSWGQAGGDSLAALRLWFLIEEMLGTHLDLKALSSEATPAGLIATIEKSLDLSLVTPTTDDNVSRLHVFFMPPYGGDNPALARFRMAFRHNIRFTVINYPSWREMLDARADFDVIVTAAVTQILANKGGGPCLLAGYSFGGFVAWETACRLIESGTEVNFVGLIDTRRASVLQQKLSVRIRKIFHPDWWWRKFAYAFSWQQILRSFIRISAYPILRRLGHLALRLPAKAAYAFHSNLIQQLRLKSLKDRRCGPLETSVTLFRSDAGLAMTPDFGWGALCSKLTVIPIGGTHTSVLEPPYRAILCKRFMEALNEACNQSARSESHDASQQLEAEPRHHLVG